MSGSSGDRPDLIVVGDVTIDVSVRAGDLAHGGDVDGEVAIRPGGSAANAAVWAAAHGARVRLYGCVGADLAGRLLQEALRERGVDTILQVDPDARTGAILAVPADGERSMVADRGANTRLSPDDLPSTLEAGAVLVSGYPLFHARSEAAARAALERARASHVSVDAASWPLVRHYGAERFVEATGPATLLLANEAEAQELAPGSAEDAAVTLARTYDAVIVKLGSRGAVLARGHAVVRATSPPIREADSTGAGDAFDGALLACLARGVSIEEALPAACAAGARAAASPSTWPEP